MISVMPIYRVHNRKKNEGGTGSRLLDITDVAFVFVDFAILPIFIFQLNFSQSKRITSNFSSHR